mgnify:CR=1 FL=1
MWVFDILRCLATDPRSALLPADIYSFGVLLWELLTSDYPWLGESNVQIIYK